VLAAPAPAVAQQPQALSDAARDPFASHAIGIELAGALFVESWNLNRRRETLQGALFGFTWAPMERLALVAEISGTRVAQAGPRDAFLIGISPLARWRVLDRPRWSWFVEAGPGASWSDTVVPPGGTRFNFLLQAGAGALVRAGDRSRVLLGFRWFHLSNNGRQGRDRNPDIQALGGYVGVLMPL
jgi:hypothetical protein